jgi:hypothetical protein
MPQVLYELAVLGSPSDEQVSALRDTLRRAVALFGLELDQEVVLQIQPPEFIPKQRIPSAAVYFGAPNAPQANLLFLLERAIPILPVISETSRVSIEIPEILRRLNCITYRDGGAQRIASVMLECVGLLPRQRRIFVSYRRGEAREAALQLFDELSSRLFEVFLDTHGIPPAEDFQAMLWHRLCDSDVLVMLDTPGYFESRWTNAEFGRALAKGICVLRIGWPDSTPSPRTTTASRVELLPTEIDSGTGRLDSQAIERICHQLEEVRSQSHAVRSVNLISNLKIAIQTIGGKVVGVGLNRAVHIQLPNGKEVVVYPTVGVPTSITLHDAASNSPSQPVAVVFDHVGLHPNWLAHLDWLGTHIQAVQWVKASEASWTFADWRD